MRKPAELTKQEFYNLRDNLFLWGQSNAKTNNTQAMEADDFGVSNNLQLYEELKKSSINKTNYNILKEIIRHRYRPSIPAAAVADVDIWLMAANGLLKLNDKWPSFDIDVQQLDRLVDVGKELQLLNSQLNYTSIIENKKATLKADKQLLDTLMENYRTSLMHFLPERLQEYKRQFCSKNFKGVDAFDFVYPAAKSYMAVIDYFGRSSYDTSDHKIFQESEFFYKILPYEIGLLDSMGFTKTVFYFNLRFNSDVESNPYLIVDNKQVFCNELTSMPADFSISYSTGLHNEGRYDLTPLRGSFTGFSMNDRYLVQYKCPNYPPYKKRRTTHFYEGLYNKYLPLLKDFLKLDAKNEPTDFNNRLYYVNKKNKILDSIFHYCIAQARANTYGHLLQQMQQYQNDFIANLDFNYELLKNYVAMTFPESMSQNDTLIGLFYGQYSIYSRETLAFDIVDKIHQVRADSSNFNNFDFTRQINTNIDSLKNYLHRLLDISAMRRRPEVIHGIAITLKHLQILRRKLNSGK